ncbi:glycoside hydrolase family 16 protein [Nocardioides humi]|uniref:GH16 domain-containing protein n=1 Tax=Nocardioides humi TaxID=449461 RepID=A0ABN2B9U0_9ACTN|nr:glycoside hydrolase family 16 protein [Nocardioides humi]
MGNPSTLRPDSPPRRPRRHWRPTPLVVGAVIAVALGLGVVPDQVQPTAAERRAARPTISLPIQQGVRLAFAGRVRPRAAARLQVRRATGWKDVARDRASRRGQYVVTTVLPSRTRSYRVVADGRASVVRKLTVAPAAAPAPGGADVAPPAAVPTPASPASPAEPDPRPDLPTPDVPAAEQRPEEPAQEPAEKSPEEAAPAEPAEEAEPAAPSDDCGERPQKSDDTYWSCTFVDEFDGSTLDGAKWMPQQTWFSGMVGGDAGCYVSNPETISVGGGVLRLTSRRNLPPFTCVSPYGSFASRATVATVATRSRFTQVYGRFEARMRVPAERGIAGSHAAFWLYPQEHTYGVWPASGEIDVAEWFSARPANVYPSVHYEGEVPLLSSGGTCAIPTASSAFHTYAVEWTPTVMRFYYDDKLCFSHRWTPTRQTPPQPFDQPFYLVLTQVWGAAWNAPVAAMPDSSTLEVDWVRAWQ